MPGDLKAYKEFAELLCNWSTIVLSSIQMCATTITIIYLARKERYKQLSWKIILQIALLWTLPPMIIIGNVWMVRNSKHSLRDVNPAPSDWVFIEFTVA